MQFILRTVPKEELRYPAVGDWIPREDGGEIQVLKIGNEDYEFLVMVHELVEYYLCYRRGITDEEVCKFDKEYAKSGKEGEPGDDPQAPYWREHSIATVIERLLATELGINWREYDNTWAKKYGEVKDFLEKKETQQLSFDFSK